MIQIKKIFVNLFILQGCQLYTVYFHTMCNFDFINRKKYIHALPSIQFLCRLVQKGNFVNYIVTEGENGTGKKWNKPLVLFKEILVVFAVYIVTQGLLLTSRNWENTPEYENQGPKTAFIVFHATRWGNLWSGQELHWNKKWASFLTRDQEALLLILIGFPLH